MAEFLKDTDQQDMCKSLGHRYCMVSAQIGKKDNTSYIYNTNYKVESKMYNT